MVNRCPVLAFTPDVEEAMAVFRHAYEVTSNGFGAVWYRRTALPVEGGIEAQPAKVMQQLQWLERLNNDQMAARMKEQREVKRREDGDDDV